MGKAKTWSPEECEGAAKAYVDATLDEIRGAEQRGEEFALRVHTCFELYSPPGVRGSGTWSDTVGTLTETRRRFGTTFATRCRRMFSVSIER